MKEKKIGFIRCVPDGSTLLVNIQRGDSIDAWLDSESVSFTAFCGELFTHREVHATIFDHINIEKKKARLITWLSINIRNHNKCICQYVQSIYNKLV